MNRVIRNGLLIDPASGFEGQQDLYIVDGRIVGRGQAPQRFSADESIDASGLMVCPGLVDLRVRLREPGDSQHGDMDSELRAAVAGGITSLATPPDTDPVADHANVIRHQLARAKQVGLAKVYPLAALTVGLQGQQLSEIASLREAGAIAMSQADRSIKDSAVLYNALSYAATFNSRVFLHSEDTWLGQGEAHAGEVSTRLGLSGHPSEAEAIGIDRDLLLARRCGVCVHFQHLSSALALERLPNAGPLVSADVSINHLHLTHYDIGYFNTLAKTTPPLRSHRDRDALRAAVSSGQIQAISSDHSPWHSDAKRDTFRQASVGISGLDTLLALTLRLVDDGCLTLMQAIERITLGPARILGIPAGTLAVGAIADLCIFDATVPFVVQPADFISKGQNSPYQGWELRGRVRYTLVDGRVVFRRGM